MPVRRVVATHPKVGNSAVGKKETKVSEQAMKGDCYGGLGEEWRDKKAALSSLHAVHPVTLPYFMKAMGGDWIMTRPITLSNFRPTPTDTTESSQVCCR